MKAISIPEKKALRIKHAIIMPISIYQGLLFLFLSSNLLANLLLKKNIKTERTAIPRKRKCWSLS